MTQVLHQLTDTGEATLVFDSRGTLALTAGLQTMVFQSLFTNARDTVKDSYATERNGWWADTDDDKIGSHLWKLRREPFTQSAIVLAKVYAEESLKWMVVDGIAKSITCIAERYDGDTLALRVEIQQPEGEVYSQLWKVHRGSL